MIALVITPVEPAVVTLRIQHPARTASTVQNDSSSSQQGRTEPAFASSHLSATQIFLGASLKTALAMPHVQLVGLERTQQVSMTAIVARDQNILRWLWLIQTSKLASVKKLDTMTKHLLIPSQLGLPQSSWLS